MHSNYKIIKIILKRKSISRSGLKLSSKLSKLKIDLWDSNIMNDTLLTF